MSDNFIFSSFILLVDDEEEASAFYIDKLGFTRIDDRPRADGSRWVTLAPAEGSPMQIVLKRAVTRDEQAMVGLQAGDGIIGTLTVRHLAGLRIMLTKCDVHVTASTFEPDETKAFVISDLYGNRWEFVQASTAACTNDNLPLASVS
ncbi:VOC family protein [Salinimonas chungwhensis]|uniref:VOC family protein n=1 Tax=Salinimonas chungwhensis TaxID=265425 RepID=UPI00037421A0|nr:VOC family protein [Salinimonas chungwhensis]